MALFIGFRLFTERGQLLLEGVEGVADGDLPKVDHGHPNFQSGLDVATDNICGDTGEAREELLHHFCLDWAKRSKNLRQVFDALE